MNANLQHLIVKCEFETIIYTFFAVISFVCNMGIAKSTLKTTAKSRCFAFLFVSLHHKTK